MSAACPVRRQSRKMPVVPVCLLKHRLGRDSKGCASPRKHDGHAWPAPCCAPATRLGSPAKINNSTEKPVMSPAEARLKQVPSEMTDAEWGQRVNLAACYR